MKSLPELIHDYKSGVPGTDAKILQRMQPLIKGTAAKIHCMEREDSQQELYLSLLQAIPYLNEDSSEGECVKYIQTVIQNRYKSLGGYACNLGQRSYAHFSMPDMAGSHIAGSPLYICLHLCCL